MNVETVKLLIELIVLRELLESNNGRCSEKYGKCRQGECCSKYGYCGTSIKYCKKSSGCQSHYGICW
ncbi:hypothetical protein H8356DRAFT_1375401 [Neocallimastix lanati (nom. inval.)]|nr:hypothetical protein H8356DRAFT_1375401 [Neocallimastix sp. JGI-2020a]